MSDSLMPERRRRRRSEVNIVPLVDVLTVLIFFFLVSMQFRDVQTLNVTLPEMSTAGKNVLPESIDITISVEGEFYYNGQRIERTQIEGLLREIKSRALASQEVPVIIRADEKTQLENVTYTMDACRRAGFNDFRLQSR